MRDTMARLILSLLLLLSLLLTLASSLPVRADDGNYYNFDYEDFWKPYTEFGFSNPGESRLPCNGSSEDSCTWAWEPWYEHGTDVPWIWPELWEGRTVSGYAILFSYHGSNKNLHGGIYRREPVQQGHLYCFTMYARAGLDQEHPASTNSRMQVGISPIGDYPDQIVLTADRIDAINWSAESNSQYAYEKQGVVAKAQSDIITVLTRAHTDANNQPYVFWDEGSFAEVPLVDPDQALPAPSEHIKNVTVVTSTGEAAISWNTDGINTLGQVIYRRIRPTEITTPTIPTTMTERIYLPLVVAQNLVPTAWQQSEVDDAWGTEHTIQLTGLTTYSIYEYIIVAYGYIDGECGYIVSDPLRFETP